MTTDWEVFKEDPWQDIECGAYPRGRRLYLNDERYWISRNSSNQLVFYIQDVCTTVIPVKKDTSSIELKVEKYKNDEQRLVCTFLESTNETTEKFGLVVKSIAVETESFNGVAIFAKVQKELQEWSDFLKNHEQELSQSELIGFWGELYVITSLIMKKHDPLNAIRYWAGPTGSKKDISLNSLSIEVKTTSSSASKEITISSLDQLDKTTKQLYILHLFINVADNEKGVSLTYLYELVRSQVKHDFAISALFKRRAGVFFKRASLQQKNQPFVCSEINMYEVKENFPKLVRGNVHAGIVEAKYRLSIQSIQDFNVTKNIMEIINNG